MFNWLTATSKPRRRAGAISVIYIGQTTDAPPRQLREPRPPAPPIRRPPHQQRAEHGAEQRAGHGEAKPKFVERVHLLQGFRRAGNDGGIEAEEQRPERGHDGADQKDSAASAAAVGGSDGRFNSDWSMHIQGFV